MNAFASLPQARHNPSGAGNPGSDEPGGAADDPMHDAFDHHSDDGAHDEGSSGQCAQAAAPALDVPWTGSNAAPARAPAADEAQLSQWITRIAVRDEKALTALYDATVSRVYGLVLRILRRPAWAEEVVEDTYFQVWRQALRYDAKRGRALTWLLAMARSRAIDALRREVRFEHDVLEGDDALALPDLSLQTSDDWLACSEGHALLHRALCGLGAQPRQLVAMAFFSGLSHEEIAAQTALPLGTVKSQIRRALIALRAVLGDGGLQAIPG